MENAELATNRPEYRQRPTSSAWFYALCVASFGIYLFLWIHRTVRDTGVGGSERRAPLLWAAGLLCFPVCVAVLYELSRHAARIRGRPPGAGAWTAPLLYAGIVAFATLSPWRSLFAPLLLVPLPFLIVKRSLERALPAPPYAALAAAPGPRWRWPVLAVGAPAVAVALWWTDSAAMRSLARPRLEAGQLVSGREHAYTLEAPSDGWTLAESGSLGDADSDLELVSPSGGAWVVTYVHANADIDEIVDSRREILGGVLRHMIVEERRAFLPGSDFVPMSHAVYRGTIVGMGTAAYVVATLDREGLGIEVIGFAPRAGDESEVMEVVRSVSLPGASP